MNWLATLEKIACERDPARLRIVVNGRVQGVGFRPHVYRTARRAGLGGAVRNTRAGVVIEVEGARRALGEFIRDFAAHLPPLARIDAVRADEIEPLGEREFRIAPSEEAGVAEVLFPVDAATCADCLREMRSPDDRRYRYPFINCTNCGPRFTIIEGLPYDRPLTTMREFAMDDFCRAQYGDPADRRFHAEPISCPHCGPVLKLVDASWNVLHEDPIAGAQRFLREGLIVAVKGLGGYHLACLATDGRAVERLRERKHRPAKPFACMFRDMSALERCCRVDEVERTLLSSPEAPIVLLRRAGGALPDAVAPRNGYVGAFLPYTPLHYLLMETFDVLIMTSANITDEPLISTEKELARVLGPVADAALIHNRAIAHKCDDSIFFAPAGVMVPIRRARGLVPEPIPLPIAAPGGILALGGHEKSTFALSRDGRAFVSPHLGDLGDARSQDNFRREVASFERLLGVEPDVVVHDLHPDYFTTRLAARAGARTRIAVQHHHAHAASVMAELGVGEPALAVVFDGTGYGSDGSLWGGEFLLARYADFQRLAHLAYLPLPGGEAAIREPWRMGLMHLWRARGDRVLDGNLPPSVSFEGLPAGEVLELARRGINAPLASSMGRLFDAVAWLLGCGSRVTYEAEAPVALEALALAARGGDRAYSFAWGAGSPVIVEPAPVIGAIVDDLAAGVEPAEIAAAFHRAVAALVLELSHELSRAHGCVDVVLSGGVFQNRFLCEAVAERAAGGPLRIHWHELVPPNDGGVSLGQLAVAAARLAGARG
jgi:hydrogenase maturation protein HypF